MITRESAERVIARVLKGTPVFDDCGIAPTRIANAVWVHAARDGVAGNRTMLDVALYASEELTWRQRDNASNQHVRLEGGNIATYWVSVFRRALGDATAVPKGTIRVGGVDDEFEEEEMRKTLRESNARRQLSAKGIRVAPSQAKAAIEGLKPPPWKVTG